MPPTNQDDPPHELDPTHPPAADPAARGDVHGDGGEPVDETLIKTLLDRRHPPRDYRIHRRNLELR